MIQLSSVLFLVILTFAIIGYLRGFDKELVSLSGIMLALFVLAQFEQFFINLTATAENPARVLFNVQAAILLIVTFFAYQTPPGRLSQVVTTGRSARDVFQNRMLGVLTGGFNGYMVFGSLWFFLHEKGYPLDSVRPPTLGTTSADLVDMLPLTWLLDGNLLTLFVIGLFLYILIAII